MKLFSLLLALLLAWASPGQTAEPPTPNFTGQYELAKSSKSAFSLTVYQKGKVVTVSFSAAHMDGSGAAPDGDGEGELNAKGAATFKWSDSFHNAGTAVLTREGKGFRLSMKATKVEDPRALVHYDDHTLKRTSTKAPKEPSR